MSAYQSRYCATCGHRFGEYDRACAVCNRTSTVSAEQTLQYLVRHARSLPQSDDEVKRYYGLPKGGRG